MEEKGKLVDLVWAGLAAPVVVLAGVYMLGSNITQYNQKQELLSKSDHEGSLVTPSFRLPVS